MGGEVFLASVAGCFMSNLLAAVRAREAGIVTAHVAVSGTIDGTPARFTAIELVVSAEGTEPGALEKLTEIAARGCIMVNTLRDKLDFTIRVTASPAERS